MKLYILFILVLFGFLSGSTMPSTQVIYAQTRVARILSSCIHSNETNTLHGTLPGTQINYTIAMPANWNGTLLLYSHAYTSPTDPIPNPAPVASDTSTASALLQQGYALASSSYGTGWAVQE